METERTPLDAPLPHGSKHAPLKISELDRLLAIREEIDVELQAVRRRYQLADQAVLEERFAGMSRYAVGDVVLVPRLLFGKRKMWPAKIAGVHLYYNSGTHVDGREWETKTISYQVYLQQKDGEFGGSSEGYYHREIGGLAP
jgi:hypothetical protein